MSSQYRMPWRAMNILENYKSFVIKNPLLANEIEVGLKWTSYIIAGRFGRSPVVTEFIHSVSKLLNLLNDSLLRKAAGLPIHEDQLIEKMQTFLTVIEHAEVFAEVAAARIAGARGRWLIVVLLELFKFIVRLFLLRRDHRLLIVPPISPLNRQKDIPQLCGGEKTDSSITTPKPERPSITFTLKSSKRIMRKLEAAPPLVSRTWKLPKVPSSSLYDTPSQLEGKYLTAEVLHLCRPLMHLISMGAFGEFSWKPFFVALALDVTSLHILREKKDYVRAERLEMNRRVMSFIVYLLRSPFYDQYSKTQLINVLQKIADNFFGSGIIIRPLIEYLPEWQKIYFYVWS
ncbi:peroxisomal membrane protein PEX16 [Parasteatoda tepidariorum]|uniref:peroxisomal membrane protein PEX16 n=1 Tax=Parasteatoda tepidariorum TaxID=114398 RepID=UPI00077F8A56|nr:peroxisomal membrane protein PEX16 [Parasteatoda tepidariorum]